MAITPAGYGRIKRELDIANADTPEDFYRALLANSRAASEDGSMLDASDMNGKVWDIAASVLEDAAESFKRRVIRSGYPWRD